MLAIVSCKNEEEKNEATEVAVKKKPKVEKLYGFVFDDYDVVRDTIKRGDFFGSIMDRNGVGPGKVYEITEEVKDSFNPARITAGKKYFVLRAKDSAKTPEYFIYENDKINYTVLALGDSVYVQKKKRPVTIKKTRNFRCGHLFAFRSHAGTGIE